MAITTRRARTAIILASIFIFPAVISRGTQQNLAIRGFASARVAAERALEQQMRAIPDPARAESNLRHITIEPHMAGTEASHRLAEWLRDQYRSYGFDADIVSYSVWLAAAARSAAGTYLAREEDSWLLPSSRSLWIPTPITKMSSAASTSLAVGRRGRAGGVRELRHAGRLSRA